MARYPSSADLRDFRARLMSAPSVARATPGSDWYRTWRTPDGWAMHPGTDTPSWPDERANGIGYSVPAWTWTHRRNDPRNEHDAALNADARREAAAMRSRAYLRQPCGAAAAVLTLSDIAPVTCRRHADHTGSHCAHLPGVWQWWNRDGSRRDVEIPMAAYVRGGRPSDYIDPE